MTIASGVGLMFHIQAMNSSHFPCLIATFVALVSVTGCHGEEPVIPDEPTPAAWAAYRGDGALADGSLRDAAPPELCSEGNGAVTTMRVVNSTAGNISTFWVDFDCTERFYQTIAPGESKDQMSFIQHVWRFRAGDGRLLGQVVLDTSPLQEVEL